MKLFKRIALTVSLIFVASILALMLFLGPLIRGTIERGATYATGVETKLAHVDAGLFSGSLGLTELSIANPEGFRPEPFLTLASARAAWQNRSLVSDEIRVEEFVLDGIEIQLERAGGKTNYGMILDNLKKLSSKEGKADEAAEGRAKTLIIRHIEIKNVKVELSVSGTPLGSGSVKVEVPRIAIDDFRSDGSTTELVAKLTSVLIQAVLESSVKAAGDKLPADILKDLGGNLDELRKGLADPKALEGLDKDLKKSAESLIKGAEDLFKKKK